MTKILIIRLVNDSIEWLNCDEENICLAGPYCSELSSLNDLPAQLHGYQIILLVPSIGINLTYVKIPSTSKSRLLKAVPFALEDQVVEDIHALHFAIGATQVGIGKKSSPTPVAVVNQILLQQWLQPFIAHSINIDVVIPDVLTIPIMPQQWGILVERSIALVRTGVDGGFAVDLANLPDFLHLSLAEITEMHAKYPTTLVIYQFNSDLKLDLTAIAGQGITIETVILSASSLPLLSKAVSLGNKPIINLLQGSFQNKRSNHKLKKIWKIAGMMLATWLLLISMGKIIAYIYWNIESHDLQKKINTIYYELFPTASVIEEPKIRLQRLLKQAEDVKSGGNFLGLLAKTGSVLNNSQHVVIQNMLFTQDKLSLQVQVDNFINLQNLINTLERQDLIVQQDDAASTAQSVTARLTISRKKT